MFDFNPTGTRADRWTFLAFLALAWAFAGWGGYTAVRWTLARRWPAVPCTVTTSEATESSGNTPYRFRVAYRYAWAGKEYTGTTCREDFKGTDDVAEVDRLVRAYPAGARRVCFVNPGNPAEAILRHDNPWLPAALAVAMLGGGAFLGVASTGSASRATERLAGPFLLLLGLAAYALLFGWPLREGLRALGWQATPCVVTAARVRSVRHPGLVAFTSYRPEVVYRYRARGVSYRANTVNPTDVGAPWSYGPRRVVRGYPVGSAATCYVNPADPSEAVLSRAISGSQWFGLWPLLLAALGGAGVFQTVLGRPVRLGTPRFWGTLVWWAATTCAVDLLWVTGSVLYADRLDGIAEWPEFAAVGVSGTLSAALVLVGFRLATGRDQPPPAPPRRVAPAVWDADVDGRAKAGRRK